MLVRLALIYVLTISIVLYTLFYCIAQHLARVARQVKLLPTIMEAQHLKVKVPEDKLGDKRSIDL